MKKGITITQRFTLENVESVDNLNDAIFTYKEKETEGSTDTDFLLIKKMSRDEVTFDDGIKKFVIPLSQADTSKLTRIYYIEAQLIYKSGATNKWNIARKSLRPTLRTENVNGQSDGTETEDIEMTVDDIFVNGGGGPSGSYNDLTDQPLMNDKVIKGNHNGAYYGLADLDTTYTKDEVDTKLSAKQNTITGGNGIDISNDTVSVDLATSNNILGFANGKLWVNSTEIVTDVGFKSTMPYDATIRERLAYSSSSIGHALATKESVDGKQNALTVGDGIDITNDTISTKIVSSGNILKYSGGELVVLGSDIVNDVQFKSTMPYDATIRERLLQTSGSYNFQAKITSDAKLSADLVTDTTATNKFVPTHSSTESGKVLGVDSNGDLEWTTKGGGSYTFYESQTATIDYQAYNYVTAYVTNYDYLQITNTIENTLKIKFDNGEYEYANNKKIYDVSLVDTVTFSAPAPDVGTTRVIEYLVCADDNPIIKAEDLKGYKEKDVAVFYGSSVPTGLSASGDYEDVKLGDIYIKTGATPEVYIVNSVYLDETLYTGNKKKFSAEKNNIYTPIIDDSLPPSAGTDLDEGQLYIYQDSNSETYDRVFVLTFIDTSSNPNLYNWIELTSSPYALRNKQDKTDITTDTTSTTPSLTLADNHEYRYTQDLTSLTLTMPSGDFIASVVFSSGSTPTSMTYDSSIKWSGDDVTSNAFVPVASKIYNVVFWYDGININAVVRGVA